MTTPTNKPISKEQLDQFKAYKKKNPSWGSLHAVLTNQNVKNSNVAYCMNEAAQQGDHEGYALAHILMIMSKSQRLKLSKTIM